MINEVSISDMYLAAALISYGAKMVRVDTSNKNRQKFVFKDDVESVWIINEDIDEVERIYSPTIERIKIWFTDKTLFFPPTYPDSVRRIKSTIHGN